MLSPNMECLTLLIIGTFVQSQPTLSITNITTPNPVSFTTTQATSTHFTTGAPNYIFVNESLNFTDAESYCRQYYGTHLASFRALSEVMEAKLLCESNEESLFGTSVSARIHLTGRPA